jgi:hypothetical protein
MTNFRKMSILVGVLSRKHLEISGFLDFFHCSVFYKIEKRVFSIFQNTGRWKVFKNPVILNVIHQRQNPLESAKHLVWNNKDSNPTCLKFLTLFISSKFQLHNALRITHPMVRGIF